MPIYEYQCTSCHHHFDLIQKISDSPIKQCPQCFEEAVIRLISPAGFQLKGSGWYATDFKNKGKPVDTKSNKNEGTESSTDKPVEKKEGDKSKVAKSKGDE